MASARHRAFIGPRLFGSLAALATLPIYLALRGAPQEIEVMVFAWLIAPILVSYYLSRTGHYERAHMISSTALAVVVMAVCIASGGISSFAAIWLVAVPLDAALSTSRRVVAVAVVLALGCALGLVVIEAFGALPVSRGSGSIQFSIRGHRHRDRDDVRIPLSLSAPRRWLRPAANFWWSKRSGIVFLRITSATSFPGTAATAPFSSSRPRRKRCLARRRHCCWSTACSTASTWPIGPLI